MNAHQLQVWYHSKEKQWKIALIAAQATDDLSTITPDQYLVDHTAYAGWPKPRTNYTPVPESLKSLETGITEAIKRNHSDLTIDEIQVHYLGEFTRVATNEVIPHSRTPLMNRDWRMGSVYRRNYAVDVNAGTVRDLRQGGGGGSRLDIYPSKSALARQWMNFVLPPEIEGSSLYSLGFKNPEETQVLPDVYSEALIALEQSVLASTSEMIKFLNINTPMPSHLADVFKAQGEDVYPSRITQYIQFDISMYGRSDDFKKQLSKRLKFLIPVKLGDFSVSQVEPVSGITFTVSGNFEKGSFNVFATDTLANTVGSEKFFDEKYYTLARPNDTQVFLEGFLEFKRDENASGRDELVLPGAGEYKSFDIYPGRLQSYALTKSDLQ